MVAIQRGYVVVPGTAAANGEGLTAREALEGVESARGGPAVAPEAAPALEVDPPLPIWRRMALIGITVIAIGLALIAAPSRAAQNSSGTEPSSDSQTGSGGTTTGIGDTAWQQVSTLSQGRGRLAVAAVNSEIVAIGGETVGGITGLVEIWDAAQQKWRTGQSKPAPVANVGARKIIPVLMTQQNRIAELDDEESLELFKPLMDMGIDPKAYKEIYNSINAAIREIGEINGLSVVDLDREIPHTVEYMYDIVHFNDKGSILAIEIIAEKLLNVTQTQDLPFK